MNLRTASWLGLVALGVLACRASSVDIGHDEATAIANANLHASCPYGWEPSPESPLDLCCTGASFAPEYSAEAGGPVLHGGGEQCAAIARGDRPYECSFTSAGCGCTFGVAGHRYALECNATGCGCLIDPGMTSIRPTRAGEAFNGFTAIDAGTAVCAEGQAALDALWTGGCAFPPGDTIGDGGVSTCPIGYVEMSDDRGMPVCCPPDAENGYAPGCQVDAVRDSPFEWSAQCDPDAGLPGTGGSLIVGEHGYLLGCAAFYDSSGYLHPEMFCSATVDGITIESSANGGHYTCPTTRDAFLAIWTRFGLPPQ